MTMVVIHPYIASDPTMLNVEPVIQATKTPVRAIVEMWRLGISPEEIPLHLPHISLAQVFAALSYYADHQTEINRYIEANHVPEHLVHPALRSKVLAA